MKTDELNARIAKLPVWAQEHIQHITRQLNSALQDQREYLDQQSPSPFYVEYQGPDNRDKRYIQALSIAVEWQGIKLRIHANPYGDSGDGINLQWESLTNETAAMVPKSFQNVKLHSKASLR